jgi:hypothetical protein
LLIFPDCPKLKTRITMVEWNFFNSTPPHE